MQDFDAKLKSKEDCFSDILGQDEPKEQLKSALLMKRHVIIVGPPGVGKTTLAKNIARILPPMKLNDCAYHCLPDKPFCPDCRTGKTAGQRTVNGAERFMRVQGSPDLTSEDLLGDIDPIKALEFGPFSIEAFTPGKMFRANQGVLFFDEINRAPERLQNALLQVLEERKATIGNYDIEFESNFIFIGTMNPHDASTEKLSDVLLDRFDIIYMTYPETLEIEKKIVVSKGKKIVDYPEELLDATFRFIRSLRGHSQLERYPSVRASLGIYERAQSLTVLRGKDEVTSDEIRDAIMSVLAHRISLKASIKYLKDTNELINEEFAKVFPTRKSSAEKGGDR